MADDNIRYSRDLLEQISEKLEQSAAERSSEDGDPDQGTPITDLTSDNGHTLDEVAEPWASGLTVIDVTDTDIAASRTHNTAVSTEDGVLVRFVEALRRQDELTNRSAAADRSLRVELAHASDASNNDYREQYNIGYLIPPQNWVANQSFTRVPPVSGSTITTSKRGINFSTPPVCREIADDLLENGEYESLSAIVQSGVKRLLGHKPSPDAGNQYMLGIYPDKIPLFELSKDQTRRELLNFALTTMEDDTWYRKGEIVDSIAVGHESVRQKISSLTDFGILVEKNSGAPIPHYRRANTDVVELLQDWDGYPLTELFQGSQDIIWFFIHQADSEKSYSQNEINQLSEAGDTAIRNNIDSLVSAGLITTVEGTRGTEYSLSNDAELQDFLLELNNRLYQQAQESL
jgi:hypothetical protein